MNRRMSVQAGAESDLPNCTLHRCIQVLLFVQAVEIVPVSGSNRVNWHMAFVGKKYDGIEGDHTGKKYDFEVAGIESMCFEVCEIEEEVDRLSIDSTELKMTAR